MVQKINHYALENPASIYDEEALTALELAGRTAQKVNECIEEVNKIPTTIGNEVENHIADGAFDQQIEKHTQEVRTQIAQNEANFSAQINQVRTQMTQKDNNLDTAIKATDKRIDNLLSSVPEGGTTMDAEVIDARVDANGNTWTNAGANIRGSQKKVNDLLDSFTIPVLEKVTRAMNAGWYTDKGQFYENQSYRCFTVDVTPGDVYYMNTHYGAGVCGASCADASGNILTVYFSDKSGGLTHENMKTPIVIPEKGAKLRVAAQIASGGNSSYFTDYPMLYRVKGYQNNPGVIGDYVDNVVSTINDGDEIYKEVGETTQQMISEYGKPIDTDNANYQVITVKVEPGETYHIKAQAHMLKYTYVIYSNVDYPLVFGTLSSNDTTPVYVDAKINIPVGGAILRVAGLSNVGGPLVRKLISRQFSQANNAFSHLKWCCLGDSLTERNFRSEKYYHDYVQEKTGIQVVNMGLSGSGYYHYKDSEQAFFQRALNIPTDCDVLTIFGSGNDMGHIDVLGTPQDTGTDTICGCINQTITNIYAVHPLVQLGIVSPTPWTGRTPNNPECDMAKYTDALKEICALRGIPFLDLFHLSTFRPDEVSYRKLVFSKDPEGVANHPNETGHKIISGHFLEFIKSLIGTY